VKTIIIGAGIAGPAAALFLKKTGTEVQLFEAARFSDDPAGAGLNIAGFLNTVLNVVKTGNYNQI